MSSTNAHTLEVFQGKSKEWFWRALASNGEIVAVSEGYSRLESAREAGHKTFPGVEVIKIDHP